MVWATKAAVDAAMAERLGEPYKFEQIGMVDLAKNAGKELAYNLVKIDGKNAHVGPLSVKRYPKGVQANVYVLVRRGAGKIPSVHLAWGGSQCVIHRSELSPDFVAYRIKHKLLGSDTDLPLLMVHTDPPCEVEFPELQFSPDGRATLKEAAPLLAGIQEIDTEADRWYLLPNRY